MPIREIRLGRVIAYHSCDKQVGINVLLGKDKFAPSVNKWDWLGDGLYFWEENPDRALEYAIDCKEGKQKNRTQIKDPFVIGAIIDLGYCLNLTHSYCLKIVKESFDEYKILRESKGKKMPANNDTIRFLDCAVINYIHFLNKEKALPPYDTVRGAFSEGDELYPSAAFRDKTHLQICVRNMDCIQGYFLPPIFDGFESIHKSVSSILKN